MDIQYLGEHLFPGNMGRFALVLAFFSALIAAFAYLQAASSQRSDSRQWRHWGRIVFRVHSVLVLVASFFLFYILLNRFYEYRYVWAHVENDLGFGYMISSFWAGQEGSFLFWTLCQALFGNLLIRYAKNWENSVMTFFSLAQGFMVSMMLGWRFGSIQIGMDPFALLRSLPEFASDPLFQNPNYVSMILDGNGLNPLLRNFWMLSHPPILFIGFAAILVPFGYALAGLWKKQYHEWIRPALPWTLLGVLFLGAGLLLGGVWAYESLTFGGFWAWDPVENASLVPWLVLVAALHTMLIASKRKNNLFPTFLFTILALILVIYSTFLTRSGVLSDTSVHSFGNDGMGKQLLVYIFTFLILGLVLLIKNFRHLPSKDSDEPFTREFWLFIGALVLVLSAFQIIFTTSIPVLNRLIGTNLAPPSDVVAHYNAWQLPFAIVLALLIGVTHFIKWGKNDLRKFLRSVVLSAALALVCTILLVVFYEITLAGYVLYTFSALFALFSALDLVLRFYRQYVTNGAVISHLGVALFLLALMLTFSKKEVISENTSGYDLGAGFPSSENLLLVRDEILPMGEFHVTYTDKTQSGDRIVYQIDFLKKNREGEFYQVFSSYPSVLLNERMGNVYEPYSRYSLTRDIFTYVTFADLPVEGQQLAGQSLLQEAEVAINDTLQVQNHQLVLWGVEAPGGVLDPDNISITARMELITLFGQRYEVNPVFMVREGVMLHQDAEVFDLGLKFRFREVSEKPLNIILEVFEARPDFVIIKTVIFPFINLLWFSIIVMLLGFLIAFRHRWKNRDAKE
ncbi:MAG: cytochrome c biogenesis protein CcsA [Bacteroides sp.]|jgi:cytochrome c-type biogenesis protein CcmF|nr:cytochrome c biogenesis protein CcsA [Bacteroides sp.]